MIVGRYRTCQDGVSRARMDAIPCFLAGFMPQYRLLKKQFDWLTHQCVPMLMNYHESYIALTCV